VWGGNSGVLLKPAGKRKLQVEKSLFKEVILILRPKKDTMKGKSLLFGIRGDDNRKGQVQGEGNATSEGRRSRQRRHGGKGEAGWGDLQNHFMIKNGYLREVRKRVLGGKVGSAEGAQTSSTLAGKEKRRDTLAEGHPGGM